jgi:F-type H+-transporting ATPase subunit epsilon
MSELRLRVLTPGATVFDGAVAAVVVPLADGWRGVLPGHAPFRARLMAGEVVVRAHGRERLLATLGGTLAVDPAGVVVLTGVAALDTTLEALEREIGDEVRRLAAVEREAEKHFDRVYRQVARTLGRRGGGHA